jgi:DNA polymerase-3 subunit gamma/tau
VEQFVVSARKYRPEVFGDVVGQEHVTNTLRSALAHNHLAHSFLFCGPRGVGKTTCARILAKAVNCEDLQPNGDPCNACSSCRSFNEGKSLNIFELDAASNNGVEDIRSLIERLRFVPQQGKRSVYIIDEVHMLSTAAFNAFLKTLEEPPEHALFILATTEKHKILPTILSRCQKFDFKRIKADTAAEMLAHVAHHEGVAYEYEALHLVGVKADGAMRDALSIFDQLVNASAGKITLQLVQENLNVLDDSFYFQLLTAMQAGDHHQMLVHLNTIIERGFEPAKVLTGLIELFRDLLVAADEGTMALLEVPESRQEAYQEWAQALGGNLVLNALNLCSEAEQKLYNATSPRFLVELTLVKLAHLEQALDLSQASPSDNGQAEKKKPRGEAVNAGSNQPAQGNSTNGNAAQNDSPGPAAADASPATAAAGDGLRIPASLEAVEQWAGADEAGRQATSKAGRPAEPTAEPPSQPIDAQAFEAAYEELLAQLAAEKPSLHAILKERNFRIEANQWVQAVANEASEQLVQQHRDRMVAFMRKQLNNPSLILQTEVNTDLRKHERNDNRALTKEQLKQRLEQQHPILIELERRFNTRIDYDF